MAMPSELAERARKETHEQAIALVEDFARFRAVLASKSLSSSDVRGMAPHVRRLLIEDDLRKVADPRVGRLQITAPVIGPYVVQSASTPFRIFVTGGINVAGYMQEMFVVRYGPGNGPLGPLGNPGDRMSLSLDRYLSQDALCFDGQWIRRRDIIKFVANYASSVHSKRAPSEVDQLLARMRNEFGMSSQGGAVVTMPRPPALQGEYKHQPDQIDVAQYEMLCTVHHVLQSPDVHRLEASIRTEFSL